MDTPTVWEQVSLMFARYDMRRDDEGYTVYDIWTGWPAKVADDLVDLLNLMNERRQTLP